MDVPVFDDSLRTGNAMIDEQHEMLFRLSARVSARLAECIDTKTVGVDVAYEIESRANDAVADAVYGLVDYITEHFTAEEALMRDVAYPGLHGHRVLHRQLTERVAGYTFAFVNEAPVAADELVAFFVEWLTEHIMIHDKELTAWIAARAI
jgi:hemerythrin